MDHKKGQIVNRGTKVWIVNNFSCGKQCKLEDSRATSLK